MSGMISLARGAIAGSRIDIEGNLSGTIEVNSGEAEDISMGGRIEIDGGTTSTADIVIYGGAVSGTGGT